MKSWETLHHLATTTDWHSICISASATPIHLSICVSLVNKTLEHLHLGQYLYLTRSWHATLYRLRATILLRPAILSLKIMN